MIGTRNFHYEALKTPKMSWFPALHQWNIFFFFFFFFCENESEETFLVQTSADNQTHNWDTDIITK